MTNKEFRDILAQYPDDYIIQLDNAFGWETPSNKNKVDPYLYINTDFGFIEIEPPEIRDIWIKPSEALPENCQTCMIIRKEYLEDGHNTEMAESVLYDSEEKTFSTWDYYDDCEEIIPIKDVAAWMPIPQFDSAED